MNNYLNLSEYAYGEFEKFLKNESIQRTIEEMILYLNVFDIDQLTKICLTMFLSTVELKKLNKDDIDKITLMIQDIKKIELSYPINHGVIPEPTDKYLKEKLVEKIDKYGYTQVD